MRFSTSIEYAVHGILYLANVSSGGAVLVTDVASAIGVPEAYLRKVFQQLARNGILSSQRGARGGFRLAREPGQLTLKDIVEAIDGSLPIYSCLQVVRECRLSNPCPVQEAFEKARLAMAEVLEEATVEGLLNDIVKNRPVADWLKVTA